MKLEGFKNAIFYSAIGNYSNLIIQLVVNVILSRILTPEDYGIVSIVQIFQTFFQMLANMGIGPAIIQNKDLTELDINILFKYSFVLAIILSIIFAVLGYPASIFYQNNVYIAVFFILSVSVFFSTIVVVPNAELQKEKRFKDINLVMILTSVVKAVLSVVLALYGFKYYSIIIGGTVQSVFTFFLLNKKMNLNLKAKLEVTPLLKIKKFASSQFAFNFVNYFSRNLDSLLIGRYFSASALAFYNKSYQLTTYPNTILTNVISPVLQPLLSDYEEQTDFIKESYLRITRLLADIGIPISIFFFLYADDIILLLFGNQWLESIMSLRIISAIIWVKMISSSTGGIYQSANRTDLLLFSGIQSSIFNICFVIIGIYLGTIEYVAIMLSVSQVINFIINNYLLMYKVFNSNFVPLLVSLKKPLIIGFFELIILLIIPSFTDNALLNLLVRGLILVLVFIVGLFATKQLKELKDLL